MFKKSLNATMLCLTIALVVPEIVVGLGGKKPILAQKANNDVSVNVKVENGNNKIVFYNSDSTIKKEIKVALYPSFSPDKKRIVLIEESNKDSISIYDRFSNKINQFKTPMDSKGCFLSVENISISNNGYIVTVGYDHDQLSRTVSFYNPSSNHIADLKLVGDKCYVVYMDNETVAILIQLRSNDVISRKGYPSFAELRCYQIDGKLKWKHIVQDLNSIGVDSLGRVLGAQGIEALYVDENEKKIYVKGISNMGKTRTELWKKYKRWSNPKGKTIWIFDYQGKLIEEKRGW